jgi:hypothetical protein
MQGGGQTDGNRTDTDEEVSTLDAARQYWFIANMYYRLVTADEVRLWLHTRLSLLSSAMGKVSRP